MLTETRSAAAIHSAYAAYARPSARQSGDPPTALTSGKGFGMISDKVNLSPEARAMLAAGLRQSSAIAGADANSKPEEKKAEQPAPSDPFRAYRSANGEISMEAMMQIEMLPPHLRKAGKLMREASSLRDEIAGLEKDPASDAAKLDQLRQEYGAAMGALWEELDKLGLTKKMKAQDMSMEDLLDAGFNGLTSLAEDGSATHKIADDAHKIAKFKTADGEDPTAAARSQRSPLAWALDSGND